MKFEKLIIQEDGVDSGGQVGTGDMSPGFSNMTNTTGRKKKEIKDKKKSKLKSFKEFNKDSK